jgi:hypothetical protein
MEQGAFSAAGTPEESHFQVVVIQTGRKRIDARPELYQPVTRDESLDQSRETQIVIHILRFRQWRRLHRPADEDDSNPRRAGVRAPQMASGRSSHPRRWPWAECRSSVGWRATRFQGRRVDGESLGDDQPALGPIIAGCDDLQRQGYSHKARSGRMQRRFPLVLYRGSDAEKYHGWMRRSVLP